MMKECSRTGTMMWLIAKIFETISLNKINTVKDFKHNQTIINMINQVDNYYKDFDLHHLECCNYQSIFMPELGIALRDILFIITSYPVHEVLNHFICHKNLQVGGVP